MAVVGKLAHKLELNKYILGGETIHKIIQKQYKITKYTK